MALYRDRREKVDSEAARVARQRYRCFDDFGSNVEEYEHHLVEAQQADSEHLWP